MAATRGMTINSYNLEPKTNRNIFCHFFFKIEARNQARNHAQLHLHCSDSCLYHGMTPWVLDGLIKDDDDTNSGKRLNYAQFGEVSLEEKAAVFEKAILSGIQNLSP
ncbi:hypothetical protein P5673_017542 [Acropora cervicornis]|uniref:Uncharacterized protein n=1 Tax=Acropora cervicornis TaxID=6130 RepID=A0AAD9QEN4_ACRCE|nr:hypothetical protein P5673_017542 [Acropora cervicornis]